MGRFSSSVSTGTTWFPSSRPQPWPFTIPSRSWHSYYRLDTAAMFQETVRREVGEAGNDHLSGQGLRALSGEVLRPHFERMRGSRSLPSFCEI